NAFGDSVTITSNPPLTGTVSGLHGANVLNLASDFVNGVADLTSLGLAYTGNAATGAFLAAAQTGETGTSSGVTVAAGPATSFTVTGSTTQTAGQTQAITVTARDASGNVATGYTGDHTITFSGASSIGASAPTVTSKTGAAVAMGPP